MVDHYSTYGLIPKGSRDKHKRIMAFNISVLLFIYEGDGYQARYCVRWSHVVPIREDWRVPLSAT